jgi:hypothetical protein
MKRISLNPYITFSLLLIFCLGAGFFILHAISQVNFEYVQTTQEAGLN